MPTGNVKWFDIKKGYGFIVGETGEDVFVHYTSIAGDGFRSLKDGELVDYELVRSDKGLQARSVRRQAAERPASEGQLTGQQAQPTDRPAIDRTGA